LQGISFVYMYADAYVLMTFEPFEQIFMKLDINVNHL